MSPPAYLGEGLRGFGYVLVNLASTLLRPLRVEARISTPVRELLP
jgi:hypothetical protein